MKTGIEGARNKYDNGCRNMESRAFVSAMVGGHIGVAWALVIVTGSSGRHTAAALTACPTGPLA